MNKIIVVVAAILMGSVANAASFMWRASNIYGPDLSNKFTGEASLYAIIDGSATLVYSNVGVNTVNAGAVANSTTAQPLPSVLVANKNYDFYFVIETTYDGKNYTFTSNTKNVAIQSTADTPLAFGNMAEQTQTLLTSPGHGGWYAVPEPTSGLLLLCGLAGLALRRKHV